MEDGWTYAIKHYTTIYIQYCHKNLAEFGKGPKEKLVELWPSG